MTTKATPGKPFYILSIDGGGIRGAFPARILANLEKMWGTNCANKVDMLSGTSTGSILAAAAAVKAPMSTVVSMYENQGPTIFSREMLSSMLGLLEVAYRSMYSNKVLGNVLQSVLGELTMGQVEIPLILPAADIGTSRIHAFRSCFTPELQQDKNTLVKEAVLASCSAPMYFDPTAVNGHLYTDGGLWANNSTLVAMLDAQKKLGVALSDLRVISVGVGHPKEAYKIQENQEWGIFKGWQATKAIEVVVALQAESVHYYVEQILDPEQYLRIDFESDRPLPIDDCSNIPYMEQQADQWCEENAARLASFLA